MEICVAARRMALLTRCGVVWLALVALPALAETGIAVIPPGDGTLLSPYQIAELGHLVWMGDQVAASAGAYYVLTNDIEAAGTAAWNDPDTDVSVLEGFGPIGTVLGARFAGDFDGQGHAIRDLTIHRNGAMGMGLFGSIGSGGVVHDLGLEGGSVTGGLYVGALVGCAYGRVEQCYATGVVVGDYDVGGLVGNSSGTVQQSYATGTVTGDEYVGGLVGNVSGTVTQCYATGVATGEKYVGGLAGYSTDTVTQCHATGAVAGQDSVGGLVGRAYGMLQECYATGMATGGDYVGGLVGYSYRTTAQCYATGLVTGWSYVGGLVGESEGGTVRQCYATGAVTGQYFVGGLVGQNEGGTVRQCYATGAVTGAVTGSFNVGGLVGYNSSTIEQCYATGAVGGDGNVGGLVGGDDGTTEQSYWDMDSSWCDTSAGGEGRTMGEMQQQATYIDWDFTSVWGIVEDESYPYLQWSPPPFSLAVAAKGPGSVSVDPVQAGYAAGTVVNLEAVAGANAEFVRWLGPVADPTEAETTVAVAGPLTVVAVFRSARGISSIEELQKIGNDPDYTLDGRYWLTQDVDAAETASWSDPGTDDSVQEGFSPIRGDVPFTGEFDGQGYAIRDLTIYRPDVSQVGLFGMVARGGVVRNLGLEGGSVTGQDFVGGLAGCSYGTLEQCYVTAAVVGEQDYVGGLVGRNDGDTVTQCHAMGSVTGNSYVGGLVGRNDFGTVEQSYATGAVTTSNGQCIGGLVGGNLGGTIQQCYATSRATGTSSVGGLVGNNSGGIALCDATGAVDGSYMIGGLVGRNDGGTIEQCYAMGAVTGTGSAVGGLVGDNSDAAIAQCYATGVVRGGGPAVGGLVGSNYGEVTQCYATGTVTGQDNVGGLVGYNGDTATQCYAVGAVTGRDGVGGLVGAGDFGTVEQCYWDMDTSGRDTSAGGDGRTRAEMLQQGTYPGWDFADTWGIVEDLSYPYLQWSPPPFTLELTASGPGSVSADPDQESYPAGTVVNLEAAAGTDGEFVRWLGPVASPTAAETTVTVAGHLTVVALFRSARGISSIEELQKVGNDPGYTLNGRYWLTQDVDATETVSWNDPETDDSILEGFRPIGTGGVGFEGELDGQGHVIRGLTINRPDWACLGLFSMIDRDGAVHDLGLEGGSVTGQTYVGGLVGWLGRATVQRCYATGVVTGQDSVGGLVGRNTEGTLEQCYATGPVTGSDSVGGLVGNSGGTVEQCYAMGLVLGQEDVGGLIGSSEGTVEQCYWDMDTSGWATSAGGDGRTMAQMRQQGTFIDWDFADTWGIIEGLSYPYLQGSLPPFRLVAVASGPGTVSVDPVQAAYPAGTVVALRAVDGVSGEFMRWLGPVASPSALETTVTVAGHLTVVALFRTARGISSIQELQKIGNDPGYPLDGRYWLTQDLEAAGTATWNDPGTDGSVMEGFIPLGTKAPFGDEFDGQGGFTGELDGMGHVIYGLRVNRPDTAYVGLFGSIGSSGVVRHLGLEGGSVAGDGGQNAGGLAGQNCGTVEQCYASGTVAGGDSAGGLVGWNAGGTIEQCRAAVVVTGTDSVGGLLGANDGTVENCYATGTVTGESSVGGLVGANFGEVASATLQQCYATGVVTGQYAVGGLLGTNFDTVEQCYATGVVTGGDYAGGLVGSNDFGTVQQCYSKGAVTGTDNVGGLAGANDGTVEQCYWDMETSGLTTSAGGDGRTTAEMLQQATYVDWDFTTVWGIAPSRNDGYPYLLGTGTQAAVVTLSDLSHVYDGTAQSATVTTDPADLAVTVTYDGGPALPVNAGTYAVVATVTDPNWRGTDVESFTIAPATPVITWPTPAPLEYGSPLGPEQLNATADVPGSFVYDPAPGSLLGVGTHTLRVEFTPDDGDNWTPAASEVTLDVVAPAEGTYVALVDAAGVLAGQGLWDFSDIYETDVAGQPLTLNLVHDAKGRISGSATYRVVTKEDEATVPVDLSVRGTVKGRPGVVVVRLTLRGGGSARASRVSLDLSLVLDAASCTLTGPVRGRIGAGATSTAVAEVVDLVVRPPMNGTWTLRLEPEILGTKVTGNAQLTLANEVGVPMALKGKFVGGVMTLSLTAEAGSPAANGVRISRTTITPQAGGVARVDTFLGSGYGQALRW